MQSLNRRKKDENAMICLNRINDCDDSESEF